MKKKLIAAVLVLCLALSLTVPAWAIEDDVPTSGTCGENATWSYDEATKTLTISGSGAMEDYSFLYNYHSPWYSYSHQIEAVKIIGVTEIGGYAFDGCTELTSVTIPESVTRIGSGAFYGCTGLTSVTIPGGVTSIGSGAFWGCTGLTSVTIPDSMISIGSGTFSDCTGLTSVIIPENIIKMGDRVFAYCTGIENITIPESIIEIGKSICKNCTSLTDVYYASTEEQWKQIKIGDDNQELLEVATIHYNSKSAEHKVEVNGTISNGTVTLDKTVATLGETITMTVTPAEGYILADIPTVQDKNNQQIQVFSTADGKFTFAMPASDVTIQASFVQDSQSSYTVTISPAENGSITDAPASAAHGDTVTLTVTPAQGYHLDTLTVTSADDTTVNIAKNGSNYIFIMPAANVTVSATFAQDVVEPGKHSVTIASTQNGTVTANPTSAAKDATVTLTVAPSSGYKLSATPTVKDAQNNAVTVTKKSDTEYTFVMPDSAVTVSASFESTSTGSGSGGGGGGISIGGGGGSVGGGSTTTTKPTQPATPAQPETPVQPETPTVSAAERFADVQADQWYTEAVDYVVSKGLMNGTGDTTFAPGETLSRAMLAQILYNNEESIEAGQGKFSDVQSGAWYADAVNWAVQAGIVTGNSDGTFNPNGAITREQIAVILYRYAQQKGYDTSKKADLSAFADSSSISDYAKEAMAWANASGLINGMDESTLAPGGNATRAQVAAILMRFLQSVEK